MHLELRIGEEHMVKSFVQQLLRSICLGWHCVLQHQHNIAESWMMNQSNMFDREIMEAMHFRRWLDIKACLKQNALWDEKKKTDEGYDRTQKYRLV